MSELLRPDAHRVRPAARRCAIQLLALVTGPVLLLTGVLPLTAPPAGAHEGNVGYSEIRVADQVIDYTLWLDVDHLVSEVPVTSTGDVAVREGPDGNDLFVAQEDLTDLVDRSIDVTDGNGERAHAELVEITTSDVRDLDHLGGVAMMDPTELLELHLRFTFSGGIHQYQIEYDLFLPDDGVEPHSNLAWVDEGGDVGFFIFAPGGEPLVPDRLEAVEYELSPAGDGVPVALLATGAMALAAVAGLMVSRRLGRRR